MNSAQAAHICGLAEEFHPQIGHGTQMMNGTASHTFCAICASSHSPSLASPVVSLSTIDIPSEFSLPGQVTEPSAMRSFALYIRPPPAL